MYRCKDVKMYRCIDMYVQQVIRRLAFPFLSSHKREREREGEREREREFGSLYLYWTVEIWLGSR